MGLLCDCNYENIYQDNIDLIAYMSNKNKH